MIKKDNQLYRYKKYSWLFFMLRSIMFTEPSFFLKRPLGMVLTLVSVMLVIGLVAMTIILQITATVGELGKKLPAFGESVVKELEHLAEIHPDIKQQVEHLEQIEINWDTQNENEIGFLRSGTSDLLSSTFDVASGLSLCNIFPVKLICHGLHAFNSCNPLKNMVPGNYFIRIICITGMPGIIC